MRIGTVAVEVLLVASACAACGSTGIPVTRGAATTGETLSESYFITADADSGRVEAHAQFRRRNIWGNALELPAGAEVRVNGSDLEASTGGSPMPLTTGQTPAGPISSGSSYRRTLQLTQTNPQQGFTFELRSPGRPVTRRNTPLFPPAASLAGALPANVSRREGFEVWVTLASFAQNTRVDCLIVDAQGRRRATSVSSRGNGRCAFTPDQLARLVSGETLQIALIARRVRIEGMEQHFTSAATKKNVGSFSIVP